MWARSPTGRRGTRQGVPAARHPRDLPSHTPPGLYCSCIALPRCAVVHRLDFSKEHSIPPGNPFGCSSRSSQRPIPCPCSSIQLLYSCEGVLSKKQTCPEGREQPPPITVGDSEKTYTLGGGIQYLCCATGGAYTPGGRIYCLRGLKNYVKPPHETAKK